MLWVKSFHIVFVVAWFAGLFYLPRLFVYHALCEDEAGNARFKVMERKLYYGIMLPGAVLSIALGVWLWLGWFRGAANWFHAKMALVALLVGYHLYCGRLLKVFKENRNTHTHVWYRWFNEVPTVMLIAIVVVTVLKPF